MKAIAALKKTILSKVSPSASEAKAEREFAQMLVEKLYGIGAERVSFVGSAARDTGLRGDNDIDLFVQFNQDLDEEYIVKKTFDFVKKHIKAEWLVRYAEHPYLQAKIKGFKVEIIPCFVAKPHEGIKSAVDRSPLHMDYLQKRITPAQRQDVRLLKQLLKNNNLYGAELAIKGFSGLVCEYLVLNYRSFEGVIDNAAKWKPPVRIDFEKTSARQKHFTEPLVLVDAIDRNRNAAAVVSETNLVRFIALCQAFAQNPSEKFFFYKNKPRTRAEAQSLWKKRGTALALIEFNAPDLIEDILIPQLKRAEEHVVKQAQLQGYWVFDSASFVSGNGKKAFILLEFPWENKPRVRRAFGPPAWNTKAVEGFLKGKKTLRGPFVEGQRVVIELEEGNESVLEFLSWGLKKGKWGIPSHLEKPFKSARVLKNEAAFKADCTEQLGAYFARREPWW